MFFRGLFVLVFALSNAAAPSYAQQPAPTNTQFELKVLSNADAALYREVFELQEDGRWPAADQKIAEIENDILMGYVQYQRYMHPTAYRSKYSELKRWMAYYGDHPEAHKIYKLAVKRRPRGQSSPVRWTSRKWRSAPAKNLHPLYEEDYAKTSRARLQSIEGRVRYLSNRERALDALKEIDNHLRRRRITERQYDRMRSWIAASLYYQGYVDAARRISNEAAERNGDTAVLAHWIAGIIAFRDGDIADAHGHFKTMARNEHQEDSLRSAAGFWAARTALGAGAVSDVTEALEIAAQFPFTFYGQLASAQLGVEHEFSWDAPIVTEDGFGRLIETTPRVNRAIALAEIGRKTDADVEMRWANGEIADEQDYDLLAVAFALNLPAAQYDIASSGSGKYLEAGLYPIPDFSPAGGFKIDRALLFALIRQESKFKVEATSRVGARGLMQLMPRTASWVAKDRSLRMRSGRDRLYDPSFNMHLGQTYVDQLISGALKGDLFHLAAAYNGGPGNLSRWRTKMQIDDPLLFIESIPSRESRDFVEKVLTNFWIYRARFGQPALSRNKVAAGELPLYEALDRIKG
ncbi:MAG: lytic transglycosylase domain-containing protein [Marinicaulis sp.]|nr:lytic transglycosylase domain-containing protein [Marinicaulis sp.]NNE39744.1 lytic transglycosylase domain-containing protein [Marinicaulis sp.]NNL87634.1 lytic transglycosylase domain-containing protein [Marinicaulis sp.]